MPQRILQDLNLRDQIIRSWLMLLQVLLQKPLLLLKSVDLLMLNRYLRRFVFKIHEL